MATPAISCLLFAALTFTIVAGRAQTGAIMPSRSELVRSVVSVPKDFGREQLPEHFSLRRRLPTPGDQGDSQTCVAWAVAYGLLTYENNLASNPLSPEFLYRSCLVIGSSLPPKNTSDDKWPGLTPESAFAALRSQGTCFRSLMDDFHGPPSEASIRNAKAFRTYYATSTIDRSNSYTIKYRLAHGIPLIVQLSVDDNFSKFAGDTVWNAFTGTAYGLHVVLLTGWDDRKHAYEFMNSQGPSWGDCGFGWIDYKFFEEVVGYIYSCQRMPLSNSPQDREAQAASFASGKSIGYCRLCTKDEQTGRVDRGSLAFDVDPDYIDFIKEGTVLRRSSKVGALNVRA